MFLVSISKRKNPTIINKPIIIPNYIAFLHTNPNPSNQNQLREVEKEKNINNISYWTNKIHYLCKTGQVDEALTLLDHLRLRGYHPKPLNLSSIIHALCDSHRFSEAHYRFHLCIASRCVLDERTCNILIARLLDAQTPQQTLRIVRVLIASKPGFIPSLINYNRLIHQLCSIGNPFDAHQLFFDMRERGHSPNSVSYTSLINGFCQNGEMGIAQKLFDEMEDNGVVPNSLTYSVLLSGVLRKRDVKGGKEFMDKLWEKMGNEENPTVNNAAFSNLIGSLCREGYFPEVYMIAEEMPQRRNVQEEFAYGQMIDSLCKVGRYDGASRIVYIMRKRGFVPSLVSYNAIVHGLSKDRRCMRAYQLFEEGIEFGYLPTESTYKVLVEALCRESDVNKARNSLQFMLKKGLDKMRVYNIFLRALRLTDNPSELLNTLVEMLQNQCQPDVVTLNTVINGFCKMNRVEEALKVFNDMLTGTLCTPDTVTFTSVICGLLSDGRTSEALQLLHTKMPEMGLSPNTITYNAVLRGLCKLQKVDEAMKIFNDMLQNSVVVDSTTHTIMIEGLCRSNKVNEAKDFWENIVWPSKIHDDFVYAAILKGLCSSGKLNEACDFLYELVDCGILPNIVNYNILIDNACKLGLKKEAYQILGEMRKNGLSPDAVTWRILNKLHGNTRKQFDDHDLSFEARIFGEISKKMDSKEKRKEPAIERKRKQY